MRTFEVAVREATVSLSPDAARNRLERAISVTDIERSDSPLAGTLDAWGMACRYEWTVEPTEEGTTVRESLSVNGVGFLALVGFLPALLLLSVGLLALVTDAVSLVYVRSTGTGEPTVVTWPARVATLLGFFVAGLSAAYFYRASEIPSPVAERFSEDATDRRTEHVLVGLCVLMAPLAVPILGIVALPLLPDASLFSRYVVRWFAGSTLVVSAVGTAVVGAAYVAGDASWLRRSVGPLRRFEYDGGDPVPYRTVEARYGGGSGSIPLSAMESRLSEAADAVGINLDPELVDSAGSHEVMTGKTDWHGIDVTYEWEIVTEGQVGEQEHTVRETMLLDGGFPVVVSTMALSAAAFVFTLQFDRVFELLSDSPALLQFTCLMFSFVLATSSVALLYLPQLVFPYGLEVVSDDGRIETPQLAIGWYVIAFSVLLAVGMLWPDDLTPVVPALAVAGLLLGGFVAAGSYHRFASHRTTLPNPFDLPPPMDHYVGAFMLLLSVPVPIAHVGVEAVSAALLPILSILAAGILVWVVGSSRADREIRLALFQSRDVGSGGGAPSRALGYFLAVGLSIGVVVAPLWVAADVVATGESAMRFPVAGAFAAVAAVPVCGVGYQIARGAAEIRRTLGNSRPVDPAAYDLPADLIDAELRVYDGPPGGARGLSFGWRDVVVFSTGDAAALESEELAALLAHEDAHASRYADGVISVFAPLVAGLTGTGQNVLFAALRFDRREIRADEYAADRVSPEAVASALRTVRDVRVTNRAAGSGPRRRAAAAPFSSFAPREDALSWIDETFGLFFGPYTMTKAHPTVETRIDRLESLAAESAREAKAADGEAT